MRPTGVIIGGWEYIIAAYVVTSVFLVGYAMSLLHRWRKARNPDDD